MKRTKESHNIHEEIVKLRHDFSNINLKNRVTLKGHDSLKLKSSVFNDESLFDKCLNTNEVEDNFLLHEFSDDLTELEIRNDNEFKVNPKIKPLKHIKIFRETQYYRKPRHAKKGLLDLNKDINENNEDIFRVECTKKSCSPHNLEESKHVEESSKQVLQENVNPNNLNVPPASDLQNLLVMMAISSKSNENEDIDNEVEINNVETQKSKIDYSNIDLNDDPKTSMIPEGIDNILSITPIRVQTDNKKTYLLKKFVNKWKCYVNNRKKYISEQRQETLNIFFDKLAKKKMDINQSTESENKSKLLVRDYNTYQHR